MRSRLPGGRIKPLPTERSMSETGVSTDPDAPSGGLARWSGGIYRDGRRVLSIGPVLLEALGTDAVGEFGLGSLLDIEL